MRWPLFVAVLSIVLALNIQYAEANSQTVAIQLSQSCQVMLKNNITTTCPSYEQLYDLGLDTSLPG